MRWSVSMCWRNLDALPTKLLLVVNFATSSSRNMEIGRPCLAHSPINLTIRLQSLYIHEVGRATDDRFCLTVLSQYRDATGSVRHRNHHSPFRVCRWGNTSFSRWGQSYPRVNNGTPLRNRPARLVHQHQPRGGESHVWTPSCACLQPRSHLCRNPSPMRPQR